MGQAILRVVEPAEGTTTTRPNRNVPVVKVRLVKTGEKAKTQYRVINNSARAAEIFRQCLDDAPQEEFWVMPLNAKHHPIHVSMVSSGTLTASMVHPRELFKSLVLANAVAFIACHNHPSGNPNPSEEDHLLTRRLEQAAELMGIKMLDHIILGDEGRMFSFAYEGLVNAPK